MARRLITFAQAIKHATTKYDRLSVLLGNGFSIDYSPEIFAYDSLAEEARLERLSVDKQELFDEVGSTDFETVVERLRTAAKLTILYGGHKRLARQLNADARVVRAGLADVIAERHPGSAQDLTHDEIVHAREFLQHFRDIFSLNYDLLLYWVVNNRVRPLQVPRRDGFGWDGDGLRWSSNRLQRLHFLHGALHLFVEDRRLSKLRYAEHGRIVDELRDRLSLEVYPLIVTEGKQEEKEQHIRRSAYLRTAHNRLAEAEGALFIHGVSMDPNDDHIFKHIESEKSGIVHLYVGIHRDPGSVGARKIMRRVDQIRERREELGGAKLRTKFYRSESAAVWRDS